MEQRRRRPPTQPQPQLQLPLHSEEAASLLREALFRLEAEEGYSCTIADTGDGM